MICDGETTGIKESHDERGLNLKLLSRTRMCIASARMRSRARSRRHVVPSKTLFMEVVTVDCLVFRIACG